MSKKLYLVNTFVSFRHQYVIEAESLEHACDEVAMKDSGHPKDNFSEVTQKFLGEQIVDGREITKSEFDSMLESFKQNKEELCSYWLGDQLIRKIDYDR